MSSSPYVSVAELEAVDLGDRVDQFDEVLHGMMSRLTGDVMIAVTQSAALRYFFTAIPGTHFGIGVRVAAPDHTYRR